MANMTPCGEASRIVLIGVGSPDHFSAWNDLSCEALAGHLRGECGAAVSVSIFHIGDKAGIGVLETSPTPHIVGLSLQPGSLPLADEIMGWCRQRWKDSLYLFGNQVAMYNPERVIERYGTGICILGEGEESLAGIVDCVRHGTNLRPIPNLVFRDGSKLVKTELRTPALEKLIHPPACDTVREVIGRGGNVMVQASRGCTWAACSYCTRRSFRHGKRWEGFPLTRVERNLTELIALGANEFEFADDEFFGGRIPERMERVHEIAGMLKRLRSETGQPITFRVFARPDTIYVKGDAAGNRRMKSLLKELKAAGLCRLYLGVESACNTQLRRYARGLTVTEVTHSIRVIKELDIELDCGFLMFDPQVKPEELRRNIKFFRGHDLIHHNQWPWRNLVVNDGSNGLQAMRKSGLLTGNSDPNYLSHEYRFQNEFIGELFRMVEAVSRETREVVYAMKVISKKQFDESKKTAESRAAQEIVEECGMIFLEFMEEMLSAEKKVSKRRKRLLLKIASLIEKGIVADPDGFISERLKAILPRPLKPTFTASSSTTIPEAHRDAA